MVPNKYSRISKQKWNGRETNELGQGWGGRKASKEEVASGFICDGSPSTLDETHIPHWGNKVSC